MCLRNVGLGLLIIILVTPLTGCRGESEPPPMVPSPTTTPVRTAALLITASVTKDALTLAPTVTSTRTAVPTRTPRPTQTPTILPTATQPSTPTPFAKVELPIGELAFISYDQQLLVRDLAGEICAIAKGGIARSPAWNPDGTRLAFSYQADDQAAAELRIHDLQTGVQATVWTDPDLEPPHAEPIREIAWSPSGQYLAFSQGCCPLGPVSIWDLDAAALAGYRGTYSMFWKPDEDVLTLSIPQAVGELIPIGSGDSTSIALIRPYAISLTVVLTGTAEMLYDPRAWLASDKLAYTRLVLNDEGKVTERAWWTARIVDGEAVDHQQLDAPPLRHDNDPLQEHLLPWLPGVAVGDYVWSADGTWVVFSANQDREEPWRIYAFHWPEGQLVGPLAEGFDLALAPTVLSASPTAAEILAQGEELAFEVCGESTTWVRPTEHVQNAKWWRSERYSGTDEQVVQYPWTHDFFVMYGHGSVVYDIENLSGLWSLAARRKAQSPVETPMVPLGTFTTSPTPAPSSTFTATPSFAPAPTSTPGRSTFADVKARSAFLLTGKRPYSGTTTLLTMGAAAGQS